MISAVLIVKNEEGVLRNCLESIKWKVDEIVVVDTGSSDSTKNIANEYADVVSEFEWCDDFSKARNYAKSLASGDFVLSIDADEVLEWELPTEPGNYTVKLKGANGEGESDAVRIFLKDAQWVWSVHEYPDVKEAEESGCTIVFGRSESHDHDPARNLRILAKSYQEDPENPRTLYYLARELVSIGKFDECLDALSQYRKVSKYLPEIADSYVIEALCHERKSDSKSATVSALMALGCNPDLKVCYEILSKLTGNGRWNEIGSHADDRWALQKHDFDYLWNRVWK